MSKEQSLALFLDRQAADLAEDLEWALKRLDELKNHTRPDNEHARRYIEANRHLKDRRAYEAACDATTKQPSPST